MLTKSELSSSPFKWQSIAKEIELEGRFDRQIRIWDLSAQNEIEISSVVLLGSTTAGTETLKNLILCGISSFTIVDDSIVTVADLKHNFYVNVEDLGRSRPKAIASCLAALNDKILANYNELASKIYVNTYEQSVEKFLDQKQSADMKQKKTILVLCIPSLKLLNRASLYSRKNDIPVVFVWDYAYYGYIRISSPMPHLVRRSHDSNYIDFRLNDTWQELEKYIDDLENDKINQDFPFIVLLLKVRQFLISKYQKIEFSQKEDAIAFLKNNFKASENLEKAVKSLYLLFQQNFIPKTLNKIFERAKSLDHYEIELEPYWLLVLALKEFVRIFNNLTLKGTLPDMESNSQRYLDILKLYKEKSLKDIKKFTKILETIQKNWSTKYKFNESEIQNFCNYSYDLCMVIYEPIDTFLDCEKERKASGSNSHEGVSEVQSFNEEAVFEALDFYVKKFDHNSDISQLKSQALTDGKSGGCLKVLSEISNCNAQQFASISSIIGSLAAQEIIKIITGHYLPISRTCVYDGINCLVVSK